MENQLTGGVWAHSSTKWWLDCRLSIPRVDHNFLIKLSSAIPTFLHTSIINWEIYLKVFFRKNLKIDWEVKEGLH